MPQFQDDIFLGGTPGFGGVPPGPEGGPAQGNASVPMAGVGPVGRVHVFDILPAATQTANIGNALVSGAAATFAAAATQTATTLGPGAGATFVILGDGTPAIQLDVDRAVTLQSAGNLAGVTFTINGYDRYGQRLSFQLAGPNAATVTTTKTFRGIISVVASAAVGTALQVGTSNIFGLPFRVTDRTYIAHVGYNNVLARDGGVLVPGDATSPATAVTGDVRGTYAPSGVTTGTQRVVVVIALTGIQCGPNATRLGAYGVTQNLST